MRGKVKKIPVRCFYYFYLFIFMLFSGQHIGPLIVRKPATFQCGQGLSLIFFCTIFTAVCMVFMYIGECLWGRSGPCSLLLIYVLGQLFLGSKAESRVSSERTFANSSLMSWPSTGCPCMHVQSCFMTIVDLRLLIAVYCTTWMVLHV